MQSPKASNQQTPLKPQEDFERRRSLAAAEYVENQILHGGFADEHRMLFQILIDPPWFVETLVDSALLKWQDMLDLGQLDGVIELCDRWMECRRVLSTNICPKARRAFAELVVRVAADLRSSSMGCPRGNCQWN